MTMLFKHSAGYAAILPAVFLLISSDGMLTYAKGHSALYMSEQANAAEQDSQFKREARDNLDRGVKAFAEQKYDKAAQFIEKAVELDPDFEPARMYLATVYTNQFVPGSPDPKSILMAYKAIETFKQVVERAKDPANPNMSAMLSIAVLYYRLKEYRESKAWYNSVLKIDPRHAEAYFGIARVNLGYSLEQTGIKGEKVKSMSLDEKATIRGIVDEGLTCLRKVLEVRPNNRNVQKYQNLLLREKSKLEK
jgi:tetratricopeptide (TPR) repeat protein